MEIGRINAVSPVPRLRATQSAPDVVGVYAVELRKQERQEADIADEERAARGLEDEEDTEPAAGDPGSGEPSADATPPNGTISFFA